MDTGTRYAATDGDLIAQAGEGIRRLLQRPVEYTAALLPQLLFSEVERIAAFSGQKNGAVAIAAVIHRARLRLAAQEASEHQTVIEKTVPYDSRKSDFRRTVGVSGPGIREVRAPSGL